MRLRFWKSEHQRLQARLSEYLDGRLDEAHRGALEAHLSQCQSCAQELDSLRATVKLLRRVPSLEIPRSFRLTQAPAISIRLIWPLRAIQVATAVTALALAIVAGGDLLGVFGEPAPEVAPTPTSAPAPAAGPESADAVTTSKAPMVETPAPLTGETPSEQVLQGRGTAIGALKVGLAALLAVLAATTTFFLWRRRVSF